MSWVHVVRNIHSRSSAESGMVETLGPTTVIKQRVPSNQPLQDFHDRRQRHRTPNATSRILLRGWREHRRRAQV